MLFSFLGAWAREGSPWPAVDCDLPPGPKLVMGALSNGIRYAIFPNAEPTRQQAIIFSRGQRSWMETRSTMPVGQILGIPCADQP